MQLYTTPQSPYGRKARIIIRELKSLTEVAKVEEVMVKLPADEKLRAINPLGKIPALVLNDGSVLFDSPVICEHLDYVGEGKFFPRHSIFNESSGRWRALTLQALGDGLADAVVRRNQEIRVGNAEVIERQTKAIDGSFAVLERACAKFPKEPTIGEIALACAIGYLDLRVPEEGWRARYPKLGAWMDEFSQRPSMKATAV